MGTAVIKVIKYHNQITIQQVSRLLSWGYVLMGIDYDHRLQFDYNH